MMHVRSSALAALALAFFTSASAGAAESVTIDNFRELAPLHAPIDAQNIDYPRLEAAVFLVTNEARRARNLPLLRLHPLLARAARGHAQRMVAHDFYDHRDPTSRTVAMPQDRALQAGIRNPAIAENIHDTFAIRYDGGWVRSRGGHGQFSYSNSDSPIPMHTYLSFADSVVGDWMSSPGHRANILHRQARELGIGAQFYWQGDWPQLKVVQNFQLFHDVVAAEAPSRSQLPAVERGGQSTVGSEYQPEYEAGDELDRTGHAPEYQPEHERQYQPEPRHQPERRPAPRHRRWSTTRRSRDAGCAHGG